LQKFIKVMRNQEGQAFLENGLYIIIVVLLLAGAGYTLANLGIKPKYSELQEEIRTVTIPPLQ